MIRHVCVCPPERLARNRNCAAGLGLPWLAAFPPHDRKLAIVGGGQSAADHAAEILAWDGEILAVNGAYEWLRKLGRAPDFCVLLDPQDNMWPMLVNASSGTKWIVSDVCHPTTFEILRGLDIELWDAPQAEDEIKPHSICGGPSAISRAPLIAAVLGYQDVTMYGADSCYLGKTTHVYGASSPAVSADIPPDAVRVRCDGEEWLSILGLVGQAEYLAELIEAMNRQTKVRIRIVGRNLASAMLNAKGVWEPI